MIQKLNKTVAEVNDNLDWYIGDTATDGIKMANGSPSYPWRDLTADIVVRNITATSPAFSVWKGGIRQYEFGVGDEVFHTFHMPHDWAVGTDMYIHAHWSHNSASVTTGGVTWGFETTWAKGFDQEAFGVNVTPIVTQTASTVQYQHMVGEVQLTSATPTATEIDTALIQTDGLFIVRTFLSANTMDGGAVPFLHTVDLHYQSTNIGTLDKVPPFYG